MFEYTITKAAPLGAKDEKYGQAFWCEVAEELKPVKFNTMSDHQFQTGDKITSEESLNKRTSKGKDYLQLKKVQLAGGTQSQPQQQTTMSQNVDTAMDAVMKVLADVNKHLDSIDRDIQQLAGIDAALAAETQPVSGYDKFKQVGEQLYQDEPLPEYEG